MTISPKVESALWFLFLAMLSLSFGSLSISVITMIAPQTHFFLTPFIPVIIVMVLMLLQFLKPHATTKCLILQFLWGVYSIYDLSEQVQFLINDHLGVLHILSFLPLYAHIISLTAILFIIVYEVKAGWLQEERLLFAEKAKSSEKKSLGSSVWMNQTDVNKLTHNKGIVIGQMTKAANSSLLRLPIEAHALTFAPNRSGKFTSVIAPNLATLTATEWPGTLIVTDTKGEAYNTWGKYRANLTDKSSQKRQVHLLDPFGQTSGVSAQFNPMDVIDNNERIESHIFALMDALLEEPAREQANAKHFHSSSRNILAGFIAWVALKETGVKRSLMTVRELICTPFEEQAEILQAMRTEPLASDLPKFAANHLLSVSKDERGSCISTLSNALNWLNFKQMKTHVSCSQFTLQDIANGGMDVFVVIPSNLVNDLKPWIRLMVSLPYEAVIRYQAPHRILMMIDEMAVLGRMGPLAKAFHEASGRNLSIWGFTQNLNDITELYGKEEAANILSSAQAIQFFNVARIDNQTCEYISQAIGDTTVLTESRSDSKGSSNTQHTYFANSSQNAAVSYTETSRRLLKPEEVARLDDDAMVVFVRNSRFKTDPILCYKPKYYLRAEWQGCFQSIKVESKLATQNTTTDKTSGEKATETKSSNQESANTTISDED